VVVHAGTSQRSIHDRAARVESRRRNQVVDRPVIGMRIVTLKTIARKLGRITRLGISPQRPGPEYGPPAICSRMNSSKRFCHSEFHALKPNREYWATLRARDRSVRSNPSRVPRNGQTSNQCPVPAFSVEGENCKATSQPRGCES